MVERTVLFPRLPLLQGSKSHKSDTRESTNRGPGLLLFLTSLFFISSKCYGQDSQGLSDTPPAIGNFAVPVSQQPAPLISFGFTLIGKGVAQLNTYTDYFKGSGQYSSDLTPYFIYNPTNSTSFVITTPYAIKYKSGQNSSSGLEDLTLQVEHAFYTKSSASYSDDATIVTSMSLPTGDPSKNPPTGFGAPSYFIGATFSRMTTDWFLFTSHGLLIPFSHHKTRYGKEFFYQCGLSKNIGYVQDKWIFNLMLEVTGEYSQKNKINGIKDPNSGGNVINVTPSVYFSNKKIIVQFGVSKPFVQHLFGRQSKNNYALFTNFAWTF